MYRPGADGILRQGVSDALDRSWPGSKASIRRLRACGRKETSENDPSHPFGHRLAAQQPCRPGLLPSQRAHELKPLGPDAHPQIEACGQCDAKIRRDPLSFQAEPVAIDAHAGICPALFQCRMCVATSGGQTAASSALMLRSSLSTSETIRRRG